MRIATFNTGQAGLDLFGRRLRDGVPHATRRLPMIAEALAENEEHIDVWLLQEVYGRTALDAIAGIPGYQPFLAQSRPRRQATGLAILVRQDWEAQLLGKSLFSPLDKIEKCIANKGIMVVVVETPLGPVAFGNLHTCYDGRGDPETRKRAPVLRRRQMEKSASILERLNGDGQAILGGDFNFSLRQEPGNHAVLTSKGWRDVRETAAEFDDRGVCSWSSRNPLVTPDPDYPDQNIDLLFASGDRGWQITASHIFTDDVVALPDGDMMPLSDHYGLKAEFSVS